MQTQTAHPMTRPRRDVPPDDARWTAVQQRDAGADGRFFYSVRTTGVYCRPSCGARLPLRENVAFHATREEAEAAGFRPCRRCRPDQPSRAEQQARMVAQACRAIESADEPPDLATLAARAGVSTFHFHRVFKSVTGMTPKAYATAHRAQRVRQALPVARSVTEALYGAGFNSNARFYAASPQMLGMTPSAYRAGGADTTIRFAIAQCSLGALLVAATDKGVCAITLGDDAEVLLNELQHRFSQATLVGGEADFEQLVAQVVAMVEAPHEAHALPLDIRGTAFQQRVWQALREIPPGSTASYAEIAERLGAPKAVRAVAAACAANTLAVAIPCHRVVRSDGALSGYRWGVERKRELLARESKNEADA